MFKLPREAFPDRIAAPIIEQSTVVPPPSEVVDAPLVVEVSPEVYAAVRNTAVSKPATPEALAIIASVVEPDEQVVVEDKLFDPSSLYPAIEPYPADDVPLDERARIVEDPIKRGVFGIRANDAWYLRMVASGKMLPVDESDDHEEPDFDD